MAFWSRKSKARVLAEQQARADRTLAYPTEVQFADLVDLVEGFVPTSQGTDDDPTIKKAWFDLVPDWPIPNDVDPETPESMLGETSDELPYWRALVFALTYPDTGSVVPPLVVDPTADPARLSADPDPKGVTILDGYWRAALALGVGRTTLAAYVRRIDH